MLFIAFALSQQLHGIIETQVMERL
jgi:hypothetical protein